MVGSIGQTSNYSTSLAQAIELAASFGAIVGYFIIIVYGWHYRHAIPLDPQSGAGYWLGIGGLSTMLATTIYSLRKRFPNIYWMGSNAVWLRLHMIFGAIGSLLVLYHARFTFTAHNSGVALIATLGVSISGLAGWFIYRHVFSRYSMHRLTVSELLLEIKRSRAALDADGDAGQAIRNVLQAFADDVMGDGAQQAATLPHYIALDLRTRIQNVRLRRAITHSYAESIAITHWSAEELRAHQREALRHLSGYLSAVRAAAGFAIYDRLFGYWHWLHVPLFFFLIVTAIVHVVAVHMY